eukprot:12134472-Prorocentrum_lima.AAC.1
MMGKLVRALIITAISLQKLAYCGDNHRNRLNTSLVQWTASVEAQLREQVVRFRRAQAREISQGLE